MNDKKFVSRGGIKLEHALKTFGVDVHGLIVLDVGSSTGGFVDCLLRYGVARVYAVDTAYGELAWKLRQDPRVIVRERTNILDLRELPEQVDLVTIDVSFTSLKIVLPQVMKFLKKHGQVIALLKPQYENQKLALKNRGVVPESDHKEIIQTIIQFAQTTGYKLLGQTKSPIPGTGGNTEYFLYLTPAVSYQPTAKS